MKQYLKDEIQVLNFDEMKEQKRAKSFSRRILFSGRPSNTQRCISIIQLLLFRWRNSNNETNAATTTLAIR